MIPKMGNILKKVRELKGITQKEIADEIGVDYTAVTKIEKDIPALSNDTIKKICQILGINWLFLCGETDNIFMPDSFHKMRLKGLKSRLDNIDWLRLLTHGQTEVKILLLTRKDSEKIIAAMIRDSMNAVFLVQIDIPFSISSFSDKWNSQRIEIIKNKNFRVIPFFDRVDHELADYGSFKDIEDWTKDEIEKLIEKEFEDFLFAEEKELIKKIRRKSINVNDLSAYIDKKYGL